MRLNGELLTHIIGLPTHTKTVVNLLTDLGISPTLVNERITAYKPMEIVSPFFLSIDKSRITKLQKSQGGEYAKARTFINNIVVTKESKIDLPFGIEWDDDYDTVESKIMKFNPLVSANDWFFNMDGRTFTFTVDFYNKELVQYYLEVAPDENWAE